ncbi:unnamed protein product [Adineta steineri]|uniref:ATPase AAA-type core domain-containing protein n=1 Tax=Adineta steineri TaxID=433720 RepID=A0A813N4A5_9BILA|nr:unnamed protein product [Adineta steineri]CAF1094182.1 unnamed protein product [Adineta steineri]
MVKVTPSCRVALKNDSYTVHKILPNNVDPLVSLMMVEKVPDSTYEMSVLLYNPPGTGKTLLVRTVAQYIECTFIHVSGSELVQKFIDESSRMIRELFFMARKHAPLIIFMDEIDSTRVEGSSDSDSEVQRTMLELLNQLDVFELKQNIK